MQKWTIIWHIIWYASRYRKMLKFDITDDLNAITSDVTQVALFVGRWHLPRPSYRQTRVSKTQGWLWSAHLPG